MILLTRLKQQGLLAFYIRFNWYLFIATLLFLPLETSAFSPYSTQELEKLEKQFIQLINQSDSVERNPLANQYINHLGKKLSQFAHISTPHFFIVKSNEINAFAGPGGYIGINSQLILATENESELAAVMAHEIAHVRLHHLYRSIEHEKQMHIPMLASLLASIALGVINPTLGSGAMMASMTGFAQDSINFTRSNEKEADRIGINMLIKSGFDPRGMAGFFKKMQQNSRYYYTANIPAILRTHPLDEDRISEAENRSEHLVKKSYPNNLNYHLFKELIRVSVATDSKRLIDYYDNQCLKQNNRPLTKLTTEAKQVLGETEQNSGVYYKPVHENSSTVATTQELPRKRVNDAACHYGFTLALLSINQFQQAQTHLTPLLTEDHDNFFYQIAMAQSEAGNKQFDSALERLSNLRANEPENYAVLMTYAQALLVAGQTEQAANVLLKGSRQFKQDLPLCEELAQAQAKSHKKAYAYFTRSQCQLLQGRHRDAIKQLKQAQKLAKNDHYLQARITAMIDEIKFLSED